MARRLFDTKPISKTYVRLWILSGKFQLNFNQDIYISFKNMNLKMSSVKCHLCQAQYATIATYPVEWRGNAQWEVVGRR